MEKVKKLYGVSCKCDEGYIAVVHYNSKEAIKCGRDYIRSQFCECEFIDFKCKWNKKFDNSKLRDINIGAIDDFEFGLKKGMYSYAYGIECPKCENDEYVLSLVDGDVICSDCEDKQEKEDKE